MAEIKVYKSVANDYFVLNKNNGIPFYFKKEDLKVLIEKLSELNEEINYKRIEVKIYCCECDTVLEILENNTCYCKKCERIFSENEIRINCGV
jgi:hypothetical protein